MNGKLEIATELASGVLLNWKSLTLPIAEAVLSQTCTVSKNKLTQDCVINLNPNYVVEQLEFVASFVFNDGKEVEGTVSVSTYINHDSWNMMTMTARPYPRAAHTAVWTGSKMIILCGYDGGNYADAQICDPVTDTWTAASKTNVPGARWAHASVWTGKQMIVFGGESVLNTTRSNAGGIYTP